MSQNSRWVLVPCTIVVSCVFLMGQGCPAEMPLPGPVGLAGPDGPAGAAGPAGPAGVSPFTFTIPPGPGDIFYNDGNVGIGTNAPAARLDVRGNIRLGPAGQFNAVAGDGAENLRMLRGLVNGFGTPGVGRGTGWTVARTAGQATGDYTITFTTAFSNDVVLTTTVLDLASGTAVVPSSGTTNARIRTFNAAGALVDSVFTFIALGPR